MALYLVLDEHGVAQLREGSSHKIVAEGRLEVVGTPASPTANVDGVNLDMPIRFIGQATTTEGE